MAVEENMPQENQSNSDKRERFNVREIVVGDRMTPPLFEVSSTGDGEKPFVAKISSGSWDLAE